MAGGDESFMTLETNKKVKEQEQPHSSGQSLLGIRDDVYMLNNVSSWE